MTGFTLRKGAADKTRADVVVVGVLRSAKGPVAAPGGEPVAAAYGRRFRPLLSTLGFTGAAGEVVTVPTAGTVSSPLLVLVGLGDAVTPTGVRRAAGVAARTIENAASVTLALPATDAALVRAVAEGFALGGYAFTRYRTDAPPSSAGAAVILSDVARDDEVVSALRVAETVAAATVLARDWVNTPAADLTPDGLARAGAALAKGRRKALSARVVSEVGSGGVSGGGSGVVSGAGGSGAGGSGAGGSWVVDSLEGFGATLAVGAGSVNPPRLLVLSHSGSNSDGHLVLVGPGVTYDSGGLALRPPKALEAMKTTMAGAAAAIAAIWAVAELELPVRVTAVVPLAENLPSGTATRPGDVVTAYDGTTIEITNPAAGARLLLADGLGYAVSLSPSLVVDVATLSAQTEAALGDRVGGAFGSDEELVESVCQAADRSGEAFWPMPIPPEMRRRVAGSTVADVSAYSSNVLGEPCFAAAFAQRFTHGVPWVHLDIAGTSYNLGAAYGSTPAGATGFGVATLVELARSLVDPA